MWKILGRVVAILAVVQFILALCIFYSLYEDHYGESRQFALSSIYPNVRFGKFVGSTLLLVTGLVVFINHVQPRNIRCSVGLVTNGGLVVFALVAWWFLQRNRSDPSESIMVGLLITLPSLVQIVVLTKSPVHTQTPNNP